MVGLLYLLGGSAGGIAPGKLQDECQVNVSGWVGRLGAVRRLTLHFIYCGYPRG